MGRTVYQMVQNLKFWGVNSNKELDTKLQECRVSLTTCWEKNHNYVDIYGENKKKYRTELSEWCGPWFTGDWC